MEAGIWNARTGERVNSLLGHYRDVKSVSWSFDGSKLLTSAEDNSIKMWDARTGQLLGSTMLPPATYLVFSVAWSPLADLFATGSYRTVI
jgi:WD40 repeat protein